MTAVLDPARKAKQHGQFFTPEPVARTLVGWAVVSEQDRILDPACGDGEFLVCHERATGIELDVSHAASARKRAPSALVRIADFFEWAEHTDDRFDAAVGNPPFIRYQGFTGTIRERALRLAERIGARLPRLTSSWAPFIAVAASLLRPGGRLAFVVPAEIGHAAYAGPLLVALCANFEHVGILAVKEKLFPHLSEDAWLLTCSGYGASTSAIELNLRDRFAHDGILATPTCRVPLADLERRRGRLRRWLLPEEARRAYERLEAAHAKTFRLGDAASVGIGYVTGANDFFHLRPSVARRLGIPRRFLRAAVRKGESLPVARALTERHVQRWLDEDEPVLLLHLDESAPGVESVRTHLQTPEAEIVRGAYKCRVRDPWYVVPQVTVPHGFLTYMSGDRVALVENRARCVATNSVHVVTMRNCRSFTAIQDLWETPLAVLSCEVEGHPLGGGMLKVEPREAQNILLPASHEIVRDPALCETLHTGIAAMRRWRHRA